ncbi:superoxide dismutase [Cu-Zn] [Eurytemora carolleeae]|uniref:superoxide dismutase [Cu-Zn] n=1 Tax=Eurytemora carolleeae TaxID=1294199 RepID=UPI000C76557E|nr:superoxide dismutase [Cu-Zn] [Eurytemora carolleeae]|eukprot:XP_023323181.1 superoxide dismutase [Cu-Zn]-like [Eurytemora affinis]
MSKIEGIILGVGAKKNHGFHIHAEGSLDNDCAGAGGHFNPDQKTHGAPDAEVRHLGDLGNVHADLTGTVELRIQDSMVSLFADEEHSIIGKALVIHEGEDDLGLGGDEGSLATGNAGARAGCCIIKEVTHFRN